jgi:predicted ferric reductase
MNAGVGAFLLVLVIVASSIWRKQIGFEYDAWRISHAIFAIAAFVFALAHVEGVGYFINDPVQRVLWTALTLFWVLLIVQVRVVRPLRLARTPYRVREVRREAGRVWTLALEPVGHPGLAFAPGQFAWVSIEASPFRMKEHPFSISSAPSANGRLEFTIKELGDFTRTIGKTRTGATAYVDGPHGIFTGDLGASSTGLVFVAGGVGIAPIMSILRGLAVRGERRPLVLFFCNRVADHILFRAELDTLAERLSLRVVHVLSEPPDGWTGERGFISRDILARHLPDGFADFTYFVCGPNPMIRVAEQYLGALGVPLRSIHSEIFDLA